MKSNEKTAVLGTKDPSLTSGSATYLLYDLGQVVSNLGLTFFTVRIIRLTTHCSKLDREDLIQ